jgi:predicted outer membrane lipoprotein
VLGAAFAWLLGQSMAAASVLLRARSMITAPVA